MWDKIKSFLFKNKTTGQTVAKNTLWLSVSQIGGRLLRAVVIIYAARILGAAEWGVFSYAITLVAFLTIFMDFGFNSILMRNTTQTTDAQQKSRIVATSFWMKATLVTLGVFVVIYIAPRFTTIEKARALYPIVALILIFDSVREFINSVARSVEKMELDALFYISTNVAIIIACFAALAIAPTVVSFTWAYAIATGIGALLATYTLRKRLAGIFSDFSKKLVRPILTSAWPFAISGLLGMLMTNTDVLIIGAMLKAEQVGYYSAALRIIQLLYILPSILGTSTLPMFSRFAARNDPKMRIAFEKVVSIAFLAAIPLAIGGMVVGPQLVGAIFGPAYAPASLSLQILIATILIDFPVTIVSNALFAYDRQRNLIVYAAIGGSLNVALDLAFIPHYGIVGSAVATLLAQLVSNIYLWSRMKRVVYFEIFPRLTKIIISALCMGILSLLLVLAGVNVFFNVFFVGLVYLGLLYRLKEPLIAEMKLLVRPPAAAEAL